MPKPKPEISTSYGLRYRRGKWWDGGHGITSFAQAEILSTRRSALARHARAERDAGVAFTVVPIRCRALTSAKKNRRRTR